MLARRLFAGLVLLSSAVLAQSRIPGDHPILSSGPMVGSTSETAVSLWVQTKRAAEVQFCCWPEAATDTGDGLGRRFSERVSTRAANGYCAQIRMSGLQFGTRFRYELRIDGEVVPRPYPLTFQTLTHWRWRTDPPDFSMAIGSCAYVNEAPYDRPGKPYGGDPMIFEAIAAEKPDFMLWLGDNVYYREPDWTDVAAMDRRYAHSRAVRELQPLLGAVHHYAIWDDHDYGPDDSDWTFPLRPAALEIFKRYWANPSYGLPEAPGTFFHFNWADVDIFCLDDRYYRSSDRAPKTPAKTMWGDVQRRWLLDALSTSQAPFKLVVNGGQILNPLPKKEALNVFPEDERFLFEGLRERNITGVVFLSGDVHHAELIQRAREGTYRLLDFTSSPLTSGFHPVDEKERASPARVEGTLVEDARNFGVLRFDGKGPERRLTMECRDAEGKLRWKHVVTAAELR